MNEIYDFLKDAGTYYLATVEGNAPKIRPFGTIDIFNGHLCIQTGKKKDVSHQLHANPNAEICAFKDGKWIRVAGVLKEEESREAKTHMLDAYPDLRNMYSEDDGNTEIWYFASGSAIICSFTEAPKVFEL